MLRVFNGGFLGSLLIAATLSSGCAVTEPAEMDTSRVRSAIQEDPGKPIPEIALELGISELAVVRAMPDTIARPWQGAPRQAWAEASRWSSVRLRTERSAFVGSPSDVEIQPPGSSPADQRRFRVELDLAEIEAAWLITQLQGGEMHRGIWWFDDSGDVVLKAHLTDQNPVADRSHFQKLWDSSEPSSAE